MMKVSSVITLILSFFTIVVLYSVGFILAIFSSAMIVEYFPNIKCIITSIFLLVGTVMMSSADFWIIVKIKNRFKHHIVPSYFLMIHATGVTVYALIVVVVCCSSLLI